MIGGRVLHFEILEKLGEGGMGIVYKARDTHLDRFVAIKVLPADKADDQVGRRRFIQEAKAASALNHPNIITVYEAGEANGIDFIAMEYVAGHTLDQLIARKGLRLADALQYALQAADALARAHAAGIIHRDLKPSNIMVDEHGIVKVLDFGLAKVGERCESSPDGETATLAVRQEPQTAEGIIVGTVGYMSPEQAQGLKLDGRSDVFAFGTLLYEMITGRPAFRRETRLSTLSAVLRDEPTPPSELVAGLPRELERIVSRCLKKEPDRRFQTMADLKVALLELKEESDSGRLAPAMPAKAPRRGLARLRWAVWALLAVAVALAVYLLGPGRRAVAPALEAVPLTSYPGMEFDPSLSPDGNEVVFAWDGDKELGPFDIYRKLIGPGAPLRLTTHPASERNPVWSPDGKWIAFARILAPGRFEVVVIPALGGPERKLAEFRGPFPQPLAPLTILAWSPDGAWLAVAGKNAEKEPGIGLLSFHSGEWRQLTANNDYAPSFSPDGRTLAFVRSAGMGISDLFALKLSKQFTADGEPRRITEDYRYAQSPVWADNGRIVYSSGDFDIRGLWTVDASSGAKQRLAGVGDSAHYLTLVRTPRISRMVYSRCQYGFNTWRVEPATGRASPLIVSTYTSDYPLYSPDGKRIAFASNRSGNFEAWVCDADASNPVQLTYFGKGVNAGHSWSPDGRRLLIASRVGNERQVYVIDSTGGPVRPVPGVKTGAVFSADGRWIYSSSPLTKAHASGNYSVVKTYNFAANGVKASPDGKFLYFVKLDPPAQALWRVSLDAEGDPLGQPEPVLEGLSGQSYDPIDKGIFFMARCADGGEAPCLHFLDFATSKRRELLAIRKRIWPGLSARRDGSAVLWAQVDDYTSDLMLVDNFRLQ